VARQGYVNLLVAGQRRSREPGDSKEMVEARRRWLATGRYDRVSNLVSHVVSRAAFAAAERIGGLPLILDVGCGEGYYTRRIAGADGPDVSVAGIDVSKPAVSRAAAAHGGGWYAVASAADLPLADASVDVAVDIFGPVMADELARVVRPGGTVVAVHPGSRHLGALRALVYAESRPHEVKDPLRAASAWFAPAGSATATFPLMIDDADALVDLFTMTPYRWHAPPDIEDRLRAAAGAGFETEVDVVLTSYVRAPGPYT